MATAPKKQVGFDLAKLAKLAGPFRLYLTRQTPGGGKEPIPLPQAEWSDQEVRDFENTVATLISGGGKYDAQVTTLDGSDGFSWTFAYPEAVYPKKVPPGSQAAYAPAPPPIQGAQVTHYPPPIPYGPPNPTQGQPPAPQHFSTPVGAAPGYPPGYPQAPGYPPQPHYSYGQPIPYPPPYQPPPRSQVADSKEDALKQQLEKIRLDAQDEKHRAERAADQARHTQEMASLRDELRRMGEAAKQPVGDTPELRAAKERNALLEKQIEAQAQATRDLMVKMERQQAEARDQSARDEERRRHDETMRQMAENSHRETQALKDQMAQIQANANKSDPMLPFLMETQRQSSEIAREQARNAAAAPQQLMSIVEGVRRSSGADQVLGNIAGAYDNVANMAMKNAEMMNNFYSQQAGSPVMNMIGDALHGGKEVLAQFVTAKSKAEETKAQVDAAKEQQRAAVEYAQANAAAAAAANQAQPPMQGSAPTNGVPEQPPISDEDRQKVEEATEQRAEAEAEAAEAGEEVANLEEKLFGPILWPEVEKLRGWIVEKGEDEVDPKVIAVGLVQSAMQMQEHKIEAPIFYLFENQMWSDLFERMLPDVSREFIAACSEHTGHIVKRLSTISDPKEAKQLFEEMLNQPAPQVETQTEPQPAS